MLCRLTVNNIELFAGFLSSLISDHYLSNVSPLLQVEHLIEKVDLHNMRPLKIQSWSAFRQLIASKTLL